METSPTYAAPKITKEEFADRVLRFFDRPAKEIEFSQSGNQAYYAECKGLQISFIWGNGWTVAMPALDYNYKCYPTLSATIGALVTNLKDAADYQDRILYAMQYFHGILTSAKQGLRAMALLWNFHPYTRKVQAMESHSMSPFENLNGFRYHNNCLRNFLIA